LTLRSGQPGMRLGDLRGQRTQLLAEASAVEIDGLQLYEILNEGLHR
jgi:tRNA U55 pseudouridine synthase TruB